MAKRAKRGGRKPSPGPREPSGKLSRARAVPGSPTPEVLARRAVLAGPDGDPVYTTTVLDLLYTRGVFEQVPRADAQDLWAVARRYVYCRNVVFGCPDAPAAGGREVGNEMSDGVLRHIREDYEVLAGALGRGVLGQGIVKREVDAALVYNCMPHWLLMHMGLAKRPRPGDDRHKARFLEAIAAMSAAMESHRARRRVGSILGNVTSAQEAPPAVVLELASARATRPAGVAVTGPRREVRAAGS